MELWKKLHFYCPPILTTVELSAQQQPFAVWCV